MTIQSKKLLRLPNYYKNYIGTDMIELADKCKQLYDLVSNKEFEYDTSTTDRLLYDIEYLIDELDI